MYDKDKELQVRILTVTKMHPSKLVQPESMKFLSWQNAIQEKILLDNEADMANKEIEKRTRKTYYRQLKEEWETLKEELSKLKRKINKLTTESNNDSQKKRIARALDKIDDFDSFFILELDFTPEKEDPFEQLIDKHENCSKSLAPLITQLKIWIDAENRDTYELLDPYSDEQLMNLLVDNDRHDVTPSIAPSIVEHHEDLIVALLNELWKKKVEDLSMDDIDETYKKINRLPNIVRAVSLYLYVLDDREVVFIGATTDVNKHHCNGHRVSSLLLDQKYNSRQMEVYLCSCEVKQRRDITSLKVEFLPESEMINDLVEDLVDNYQPRFNELMKWEQVQKMAERKKNVTYSFTIVDNILCTILERQSQMVRGANY